MLVDYAHYVSGLPNSILMGKPNGHLYGQEKNLVPDLSPSSVFTCTPFSVVLLLQ